MPDKRSDNKIVSMLERTGVIRKVGSDDGSLETDSNIRALIETPDAPVKVTPAPRQPVPGMPTPVFPSEKQAEAVREQPIPREHSVPNVVVEVQPPSYEPEPFDDLPEPPPPSSTAPPLIPPKPVSTFSGLNIFRNGNSSDKLPSTESISAERGPQTENITEKFLNTEELYDALALRSKKTDTIYLIEEYLQTLPDSLPDSSRREIVNKLIAASGFDFDLLMGDGVLRVKMLKGLAEGFARHTDDYIAARQAEIDEMDQQIMRSRRLIENRKELHKKQFFSIEAEAQRLKEILTFVSG